MKKLSMTTSAIALLASVTVAQAEPVKRDYYVSGALGITSTNDADFFDSAGNNGDFSIDNDINYAIAVGKRFKENWRGEIELSYRSADIDGATLNGTSLPATTGDLDTTSLLLNGYYDFRAGKKLRPYLSAGVGLSRHSAESSITAGGSESDVVFAYQLGTGVSYAVKERTNVFGGYRYASSSDADFNGLDAEYDAHEFRVGLAYAF